MEERPGSAIDVVSCLLKKHIKDYAVNVDDTVRSDAIRDFGRVINSRQARDGLSSQQHMEYAAQLWLWAKYTTNAMHGDEAGCMLENLYARKKAEGAVKHQQRILEWFQDLGEKSANSWVQSQAQKFVELHYRN